MSHIDQPVQILIRKCHIKLKKNVFYSKKTFSENINLNKMILKNLRFRKNQ